MPATDTSIWDYVVTYGGPSLFMTAVFVVVMPLVWFKFARPRFARWPSRLAVMLAVWLLAWIVAYGDVLMIAREAKRVCETEAGLRVYRTAEVEGFAGVIDINYWNQKGFQFVEFRKPEGTIIRFTLNGQTTLNSKSEMLSLYEYANLEWDESSREGSFAPFKQVVRNMETGEILGELVHFIMHYGWLDSFFASATGAQKSYCEGSTPKHLEDLTLHSTTLIEKVLFPHIE